LKIWLDHAQEHGWPKPEFEERPFESWAGAKKWIRTNQRGRRNHNKTWSKYCFGQEYNELKAPGARTDLTSEMPSRYYGKVSVAARGSVTDALDRMVG
jgi:hypothetical protein